MSHPQWVRTPFVPRTRGVCAITLTGFEGHRQGRIGRGEWAAVTYFCVSKLTTTLVSVPA